MSTWERKQLSLVIFVTRSSYTCTTIVIIVIGWAGKENIKRDIKMAGGTNFDKSQPRAPR
jgi:hypothetical protein